MSAFGIFRALGLLPFCGSLNFLLFLTRPLFVPAHVCMVNTKGGEEEEDKGGGFGREVGNRASRGWCGTSKYR